jgi:hypothetical protein
MKSSIEICDNKSIIGRGVYATGNIKKYSKLCYYDGYITYVRPTEHEMKYKMNIEPHELKMLSRRTYGKFDATKSDDASLIGRSELRDQNGCGQLINDAYMPKFDKVDRESSVRAQLLWLCEENKKYCENFSQYNSYPSIDKDTRLIDMLATRDIKIDEEITYRYGPDYWCWIFIIATQDKYLRTILHMYKSLIIGIIETTNNYLKQIGLNVECSGNDTIDVVNIYHRMYSIYNTVEKHIHILVDSISDDELNTTYEQMTKELENKVSITKSKIFLKVKPSAMSKVLDEII